MPRMYRIARVSLVVLTAVVFLSVENVKAQDEINGLNSPPVERLALLNDAYAPSSAVPVKAKTAPGSNEPVPFSISTMASDLVPPFPAHPELTPAKPAKKVEVSFEENMPVKPKTDSIDDCCKELTAMIAGNIDSDISLEAKTMMIETALKMVARNIALKAEAKITKLEADHALEIAQMQSQMMRMRSTGSAAEQINRIAGPLSQMLQRNYQQSVAMEASNQRVSQTLAQIGYNKLEQDSRVAKESRQRIQLTNPPRSQSDQYELRISQLAEQLSRLQNELERRVQSPSRSPVQPAGYSQPLPLQPRRQPLEPLQSPYSVNDGVQYFQKGPEFKLTREAAALKEARSAGW